MSGKFIKNLKVPALALAISLTVLQVTACSSKTTTTSKGTILIGVSAAITGAAPLEGERTKQGVEMAIAEINANGGVLGKNLKADIEDDANTADTAVNVANKLDTNPDVVCQIGPNRSANAIAVQQVYAKNKIPFLTGGSSPALIVANNPYFFRIRASDSFVAKIIAKYAVEKLKATKIALLYNNDEYGTGGRDVILSYLKTINLTPVVVEGHNTGDKDMQSSILKAKNAGANCLIVYTHDPEAAIIATEIIQLGLNIPKIGPTTFVNATWLTLVDSATAENWYSVTDFIPSNSETNVKNFVDKFKAKYNVEPDLFASAYYNSVYIVADALKRAGTADRAKLQQALLSTKDLSSIYGNMTANSSGELVHTAVIAKIHDKQAVYIEKVTE